MVNFSTNIYTASEKTPKHHEAVLVKINGIQPNSDIINQDRPTIIIPSLTSILDDFAFLIFKSIPNKTKTTIGII